MDEEEHLFIPDYEDVPAPPEQTYQHGRNCILCPATTKNLKDHTLKKHLPYFWILHLTCWICKTNVKNPNNLTKNHYHDDEPQATTPYVLKLSNCLQWLAKRVLCTHSTQTIPDLLDYVLQKKLYPRTDKQRVAFNTLEQTELKPLQYYLGDPQVGLSISPPNCQAALVHWRIIAQLLEELTPQEREEFHQLQ